MTVLTLSPLDGSGDPPPRTVRRGATTDLAGAPGGIAEQLAIHSAPLLELAMNRSTAEKVSSIFARTARAGPYNDVTGAADRIAEQLVVHLTPLLLARRVESPWMNAGEAASYMRCPVSRVRKLTSTRELPCNHDGRRVLFHRDELDGFIRSGGATCP